MSAVLERALNILDLLAHHPDGLGIQQIAQTLSVPASATHRLLGDLIASGYVRQRPDSSVYALTLKLSALGSCFLGRSGLADAVQPALDELAAISGELIRLSVIDGDDLVWMAKAQGARSGLRYDPDMEQGIVAHLASSASGHAWLMTMSDQEALAAVARQSFQPADHEPGEAAPKTADALLEQLGLARERGFSMVIDSFMTGLSAMAAPVRDSRDRRVIGVISIGGPSVRLKKEKMMELGEALFATTGMVGDLAGSSPLLTAAQPRVQSGD